MLWPPDAKSWLTRKDPNAGKDWGQEEKGGGQWMRWLDGIINSMDKLWGNFEQTLGDGEDRGAWHAAGYGVAKVGHDWITEQQQQ